MTINWYRPSQCVLVLVTLSSILVFLGCLACGFLLHFAPEEPSEDVNGGIYTFVPTIVLLGAALSMVICLVLGCYGVCKDSKLALILFAVLSLVVAVVVVGSAATVFTFIMEGSIRDKMSGVLLHDLERYSENDSSHTNSFSSIQTDYHCCGVHNWSDWLNTTWKKERPQDEKAPGSCCIQNTTNCNHNPEKLWAKGCLEVLLNRMRPVVYAVFGLSVALAILQLLTSLFACYGALIIRRYQNYDVL